MTPFILALSLCAPLSSYGSYGSYGGSPGYPSSPDKLQAVVSGTLGVISQDFAGVVIIAPGVRASVELLPMLALDGSLQIGLFENILDVGGRLQLPYGRDHAHWVGLRAAYLQSLGDGRAYGDTAVAVTVGSQYQNQQLVISAEAAVYLPVTVVSARGDILAPYHDEPLATVNIGIGWQVASY